MQSDHLCWVCLICNCSDLMLKMSLHCTVPHFKNRLLCWMGTVKAHWPLKQTFCFHSSSYSKNKICSIYSAANGVAPLWVWPCRTTDPLWALLPWCSPVGPDTSLKYYWMSCSYVGLYYSFLILNHQYSCGWFCLFGGGGVTAWCGGKLPGALVDALG